MENNTSIDFVGTLPIELSHMILRFLSAQQLGVCGRVSRKWRQITNCNTLWKQFVPDHERTVPLGNYTGECNNKFLYARFATTLKKWKEFDYWEQPICGEFGYTSLGNGSIVVSVDPKKILVMNLNGRKRTKVKNVQLKMPNLYLTEHCLTSDDGDLLMVPANYGEYVLVYRWTGSELQFEDSIYCEMTPSKLITLTSYKAKGAPDESSSLIPLEPHLIVNDFVILKNSINLYIWSLSEKRHMGLFELPKKDHFLTVFYHCRKFYFGLRDKLCIYDTQVHEIIKCLQLPTVVCGDRFTRLRFQANNTTLLVVLSGLNSTTRVFAWDLDYKLICESHDLESCCALHPYLPIVCSFKTGSDEKGVSYKTLVAEDLCTKAIIWSGRIFDNVSHIKGYKPGDEDRVIRFSDRYIGIINRSSINRGVISVWQYADLITGEISEVKTVFIPLETFYALPNYYVTRTIIPCYTGLIPTLKILVFT